MQHPMPTALSRRLCVRLLAGALALGLSACSDKGQQAPVPPGSVVLALGDSLTQGVGASAEAAWPALLAQRSGWQVVNAGVSGDESGQALARLPDLLEAHQPALVLVCIGGNDFLRQKSAGATRANIDAILRQVQAQGSRAVLIGVPALGLGAALGRPSDHDLYAELAKQHGVPLLTGAWGEVMREKALMADAVHPNAQGYAQFADRLQAFLQQQGLWR